MKNRLMPICAALFLSPFLVCAGVVNIERVPENGMQPQIAVGKEGTVHMVYLTGSPKGADVRYVQRRMESQNWSRPATVNSQAGSAIAIGTIRGAQLAIGRGGSVHVCWNGASQAEPKPKMGGSPLLYSQLLPGQMSFEPQRNLMGETRHLDGGASLAADPDGRVFVMWHGAPPEREGESNRQLFLALSSDDGKTFAPERAINPQGSGACACCGVKALADGNGAVFAVFRAARDGTERAMQVLESKDHGQTFQPLLNHAWVAKQCPMSSSSLASGPEDTLAAWETAGQIFLSPLKKQLAAATPISTKGGAKHPSIAINKQGDILTVWTLGTGWEKGGSIAWKLKFKEGATTESGMREGLPKWSYAAAYAKPDGSFVILY